MSLFGSDAWQAEILVTKLETWLVASGDHFAGEVHMAGNLVDVRGVRHDYVALTRVRAVVVSFILLLLMLSATESRGQNVLFVANVDGDVAGNQSVIDRLANFFGFNVTVRDHDTPTTPVATDATGMDLVVISSTTLSGNVGTSFADADATFRAMQIPTIQWEQALHDEFMFASSGRELAGADTVTIVDPNHFLAAGLTGDVQTRTSATTFHISTENNLAPGYQIIATADGDPAIGVVEPGGLLNDGTTTASARRLDVFFGDNALVDATAEGLALFDAAVQYALGLDLSFDPGDFNDDGSIDLADFEIMLANFNQRFAFPESISRGDMNANGVVNLQDFAEFRVLFNSQGAPGAAVPEPAALALGLSAFACVFLIRRRFSTRNC